MRFVKLAIVALAIFISLPCRASYLLFSAQYPDGVLMQFPGVYPAIEYNAARLAWRWIWSADGVKHQPDMLADERPWWVEPCVWRRVRAQPFLDGQALVVAGYYPKGGGRFFGFAVGAAEDLAALQGQATMSNQYPALCREYSKGFVLAGLAFGCLAMGWLIWQTWEWSRS